MILFGIIALRIFAGRYWYREIAVRLPSVPHIILLLIGFPALPILAGGVYWMAQLYLPGMGHLFSIVSSLVIMIGVLGATWLVFYALRGHDPKIDLARSSVSRQLLIGTVLIYVAMAALGGAFLLISRVLPPMDGLAKMDQGMEDLVQETRTWHPYVAVLVIAVMPAFSEEIWCRAFLGRGLVGQYGAVCGVLITSFFFGAIHILPHQAVMAMLMGIVLHYAYITTRSLLAPMLLHFLNNATSVLGDRLGQVAANVDVGPDKIPFTLYGCGIALLAAVGWALYQSRARIIYPTGTPDHPLGGSAYPGVAMPSKYSSATISRAWPSLSACAIAFAAFGAFAMAFALVTMGYPLW
jgi:membrane protease YdiL (CAAX protease family)